MLQINPFYYIDNVIEEDLPNIIEIYKREKVLLSHYGLSFDPSVLHTILNNTRDTCWGLFFKDKLVGVMCIFVAKSSWSNETIAEDIIWHVLEEHRRHGLKLLTYAEQQLKLMGVERLYINQMGENPKLFNVLTKRFSFKKIKVTYMKNL